MTAKREMSYFVDEKTQMLTRPTVELACVSNMYVRMMRFNKKGNIEYGHTHPFDHLTLLASGSVKMKVDGKESIFHAPKMIFIRKDMIHELESLEDNTVAFCIHPIRNGEAIEDIVDPSMLPETSIETLEYLQNSGMLKFVCD